MANTTGFAAAVEFAFVSWKTGLPHFSSCKQAKDQIQQLRLERQPSLLVLPFGIWCGLDKKLSPLFVLCDQRSAAVSEEWAFTLQLERKAVNKQEVGIVPSRFLRGASQPVLIEGCYGSPTLGLNRQ
ncbi:EMAP like 3 [Podarcis lilfordi]|uniref:EMAP like 3 n=1 Tax=Podarcis lilfordi TaxID=74358 RepID=A0AA35LEJ4_9SAUR|nr:EMAP like 3 [Podarcis lilfordi]